MENKIERERERERGTITTLCLHSDTPRHGVKPKAILYTERATMSRATPKTNPNRSRARLSTLSFSFSLSLDIGLLAWSVDVEARGANCTTRWFVSALIYATMEAAALTLLWQIYLFIWIIDGPIEIFFSSLIQWHVQTLHQIGGTIFLKTCIGRSSFSHFYYENF